MTPQQIAEAQRLAREWKPKATLGRRHLRVARTETVTASTVQWTMMAIPPEVVFDRAIRGLPEPLRCKYAGKFDIDPQQHFLLNDVHTLVNGMYEAHADHFVADGNRSHRLHFDFIDGSDVNAIAFNHEDYSFVGLTVALVKEFEKLATALVSSKPVWELFGHSGLNQEKILELWTALVITMLQFVAFHELGHHMYGHCEAGDNLVFEEYGPGRAGTVDDIKEVQADELDADTFAIRTISENLLAGPARPEILEMANRPRDEETDSHLLTLITLAAGTFFFYRTSTGQDVSTITTSDHPPMPARLYEAMKTLHEWLVVNRPGSEEWVAGEEYLHVMSIGIRSFDNEGRGKDWDLQTSFLDSAGGRAYLECLEQSRQRRREFLKTKRWRMKGA